VNADVATGHADVRTSAVIIIVTNDHDNDNDDGVFNDVTTVFFLTL